MRLTISYIPFNELVECLRNDGLDKEAEKIRFMIHNVAWTTGSELIGELGNEIVKIESKFSDRLSEQSKTKINESMKMVKRVWPDFPK